MNRAGIQWIVMVGCLLSVGVGQVRAGEDIHAPIVGSQELERIKSLAGRWEGTTTHGEGAEAPAVVEYKVTSGGSAVVETLFPGTPHEMVSVYHDDAGKKLSMTHYCMLGNQPELELTGSNDQQMDFSLSSGSSIPSSEEHMHALTLTWTDSNRLTQVWTSSKDGKTTSSSTFHLARAH